MELLLRKSEFWVAVSLLIVSNVFMTFAWYGHLKFKEKALWVVILVSWAIAFFEYCLMVPANRVGSNVLAVSQLKVIQEVITFAVFSVFSILYLKQSLTVNDWLAFGFIVVAVFFSLYQPIAQV